VEPARPFSIGSLGGLFMAKRNRLAWPEPPPPLPNGLTRKIFITLPLGFTLNRPEVHARVVEGKLSQVDAERLIQEDEYRKAINVVLNYVSYWELRDWGQQIETTGRWSAPPSLPDRRRKAVWKTHYEHPKSRATSSTERKSRP
jgi:hypothetical protein